MQLGDLSIFTSKSLASIPKKNFHQNNPSYRDMEYFDVDIRQREKKIKPLEQRRKHL
jgi:hypothetical protein